VTQLEILVTHLQRELAEFNQVTIDQQRQIDALSRQLARFGERIPTEKSSEAADGASIGEESGVEDWNE
jgi:uncharacterized coiled-coil protein SlyX